MFHNINCIPNTNSYYLYNKDTISFHLFSNTFYIIHYVYFKVIGFTKRLAFDYVKNCRHYFRFHFLFIYLFAYTHNFPTFSIEYQP